MNEKFCHGTAVGNCEKENLLQHEYYRDNRHLAVYTHMYMVAGGGRGLKQQRADRGGGYTSKMGTGKRLLLYGVLYMEEAIECGRCRGGRLNDGWWGWG